MKHYYSNDDTCFSIDVIDEIIEKDFDALLYEGSDILYSIEGTILEEKLFAKFDEFIAMIIEDDIEFDKEEPTFEKITYKEGIVLGHKVSRPGLEVDKAKNDVISKLPPPTKLEQS
ncbi:hypothetical protein Tco_1330721 [Tanacetum coccineum]